MYTQLLEILALLQILLALLLAQPVPESTSGGQSTTTVTTSSMESIKIRPNTDDSQSVIDDFSVSEPENNDDETSANVQKQVISNPKPLPSYGYSKHSIMVGADTRHFMVYYPKSAKATLPVLLLLHGGGMSMNFINDGSPTARELQVLADKNGVLLVAPNGTNKNTGAFDSNTDNRWNDTRVEYANATANGPLVEAIDDQLFIRELVSYIHKNYPTNKGRTFVNGASNGGYMTQDLLRLQPDLFTAGAAFIATVSTLMEPDLPKTHKPIILWHNTYDKLVRYKGLPGLLLSAQDSAFWWARANNAQPVSQPVQVSETDTKGCYTTLQKFEGDEPVYHYVTHGGGHILSSKTYQFRSQSVLNIVEDTFGTKCNDIDPYMTMWDFFREL